MSSVANPLGNDFTGSVSPDCRREKPHGRPRPWHRRPERSSRRFFARGKSVAVQLKEQDPDNLRDCRTASYFPTKALAGVLDIFFTSAVALRICAWIMAMEAFALSVIRFTS